MTDISLPDLSLVALVGVSGSGKSTFAARHFRPSQVLSSDAFRAMVADDDNDQSATGAAFDALHHVAGLRLAGGRLTVVDATNTQRHARAEVIATARAHDVLPVAIVLDVPESVCAQRNADRAGRRLPRQAIDRQHRELHRSLRGLRKEGFRKVYVLRSAAEVDTATVSYEKQYNDKRELAGPFDIIGDVHGCRAELESLLTELGWVVDRDATGRAVSARHPAGRTAVFVGDLVDRGPDTPGVLRLVMGMVAAGTALSVCGNHEQKLVRKLSGRNVTVSHGLETTMQQLESLKPEQVAAVRTFCDGLVSHYVFDAGRLVVAHAGLKEAYHGRSSGRVRSFCLYGETSGETDEYGLPVRYPWASDYRGAATVVYGHTPIPEPEWVNNTICLDTGCVFGGRLTALRYPERELASVAAEQTWYEPVRPLVPPPRPDDLLDVADVTGRRRLDTGYGAVTIGAEESAAALEVLSRFALDPRLLYWLPPTMAPCSTSTVDGYLEYPTDAFADHRAAGVAKVVCQEKHMGSRAVVLLTRHDDVPGMPGPGALYTRTGRAFFSDGTGQELLSRLRAAATSAGLFAELDSPWLLLDAELMPWSAKAGPLIREQYAGVAAAAGASLPAALSILDAAASRGVPVDQLRDRLSRRSAAIDDYAAVYQRYCWPTDGLSGLRLAPFAVLASAGTTYADADHDWQLAMADRLVAADPALLAPTRRIVVDVDDAGSVRAGTDWWLDLTGAGGEGMVVKPHHGLRTPTGRQTQPGIKCRGREYLRIIYGPDYTEPATLTRLRERKLSRKRSMAWREHVLGLAALDRLAAGAPLYRIHELVAAILACESEPVDPRL